jgi:bifunctional UDP-N-acetylglucosamine pyrophosphorylase/glucosamine-1-phosphate N-acetyltransferase
MTELAAIVLAAGKSKRMNSALPKVLHPVLGLPLFAYTLEAAVEAGIRRLVLIASPDHRELLEQAVATWSEERPEAEGVRVDVAVQETPRGTADAVLAARRRLEGFTGTAVVLCGDAPCVSPGSIEALLREHRARVSDLSVLSAEVNDPRGYGRIVRGPDGDLAAIVEEKDATPEGRAIKEINSGILAFEMPRMWETLERVKPSRETGELYLTDAVTLAKVERRKAIAVHAAVWTDVLGVNDRAQLAEATSVLRDRINLGHMKAGVTIVDPKSAFIDPRARIGRDSTVYPYVLIEGPCEIGSGARIGPFAYIRGGSRVGDKAVVGSYVEVVRSDLGEAAKAPHLTYVGDATIGPSANLGAGTVFANFDGEAKHATKVGANAFVGSGTVLVAPCDVGERARTGAGAIVVRANVPAGETWVGVPAKKLQRRKGDA